MLKVSCDLGAGLLGGSTQKVVGLFWGYEYGWYLVQSIRVLVLVVLVGLSVLGQGGWLLFVVGAVGVVAGVCVYICVSPYGWLLQYFWYLGRMYVCPSHVSRVVYLRLVGIV